jgi:hypothetical protein
MNKLIAIYLTVSLMILVIFVQNSKSMPSAALSRSDEGGDGKFRENFNENIFILVNLYLLNKIFE